MPLPTRNKNFQISKQKKLLEKRYKTRKASRNEEPFLFYTFLRGALFILYDIQCHFANPNGALAVLIYRHLLAIEIRPVLQRLEEAVAMTSQYQVDVAGCSNHLGIIRASIFQPR